MSEIYKLQNKIKNYEWGSPDILPQFLGLQNKQARPWAEMWMGTHIGAPSQVLNGKDLVPLSQISGGQLPFLFKLLAVKKPLSLQAHPNRSQAAQGFRRENEAGIALTAPKRNYKDDNHKPELLCAITPFTLMAGFREPALISISLETFIAFAPNSEKIISTLLRILETGAKNASLLETFFRALYQLSKQDIETICACILDVAPVKNAFFDDDIESSCISPLQWELMRSFAGKYPADAAVISPLFLNIFTLKPLQSIFIPSGVLHSYISGFGAELMSNSDNVLRGGLTNKHIDAGELMKILEFKTFNPAFSSPDPQGAASLFHYPAACGEYSFSLIHGTGKPVLFAGKPPALCIVTEGELICESLTFKKGESFYVHSADSSLSFSGHYSLFAACAGEASSSSVDASSIEAVQ